MNISGTDSMGGIGGDISAVFNKTEENKAASEAVNQDFEQQVAEKSAQSEDARSVFRPKTPPPKTDIKTRSARLAKLKKVEEAKTITPKQIEEKAEEHAKKNPEFKKESLILLRKRIGRDPTAEKISETLKEFYPDATLADDALNFLLDTTEGDVKQKVQDVKDSHNAEKATEIRIGRNFNTEARQAADQKLGTPTAMRDLYRDFATNPRDANTVFKELVQNYSDPKVRDKVIKFMLHSVGIDFRTKPTIEAGERENLMSITKKLQSIVQLYRHMEKEAMPLVKKLLESAKS